MLEIAFPHLSLKIEKGSSLIITGKNASGKSRMLKFLTGLDKPEKGNIMLDERNIHELSKEEKKKFQQLTGIVLQELSLNPFELIGNKLVKECSASEKKKADLLRSLSHDPKLLLWDEPFTFLDDEAKTLFQKELMARKKTGVTIIIATLHPEQFNFLNPEKIITLPHGV